MTIRGIVFKLYANMILTFLLRKRCSITIKMFTIVEPTYHVSLKKTSLFNLKGG